MAKKNKEFRLYYVRDKMTEKDFWKALGDVFEVSDIPCSMCPAFIYNDGCMNECEASCKKSLETVYKKIVEEKK